MRIFYTKKYNKMPNQKPSVIIYNSISKIYWFGKKQKNSRFNGKVCFCNNDSISETIFFFETQNINTKYVNVYWIDEKSLDFILPKIKSIKDVSRIIDSLIEQK